MGLIPSGLAPFYVMKLATHTFEMGRCNIKDGMKSVMLDGKLNYDPEDPYLESVPLPNGVRAQSLLR